MTLYYWSRQVKASRQPLIVIYPTVNCPLADARGYRYYRGNTVVPLDVDMSRPQVIVCALVCVALNAQQKPSQVSGHVRRADTGEPVAKAIVTLHPQDQASAQAGERVVSTGADGAFALADVVPGVYAIEAERNGFIFRDDGHERLTVRAGQDASNIELQLAPAAVISGVVLDQDGEPVQGLSVMALRLKYLRGGTPQLSWGQSAITDDQGKFRLYGTPEGLYYVRTGGRLERPMTSVPLKRGPGRSLEYGDAWYPENAFDEYSEPLRVEAGADIRGIRILVKPEPTFRIAGRVEGDARGPRPTEIRCARRLPFTLTFGGPDTEIEADGSFKIENLAVGEYVLTAQAVSDGQLDYQGFAKVRIIDGDVRVNIPLGQAAGVSGTVSEEGTKALPAGLQVMLELEGGTGYLSDLDKSGGFDFHDVPPGEHRFGLYGRRDEGEPFFLKRVTCSGADYTTLPLKLDAGVPMGDCKIQISKETGVVRGDVLEGDKPLAGMAVVLIPESRELRRIRRYTLRVKTDGQGKFEIPNAIPGKYLLFALRPNGDEREFALSFADRNLGEAQSVEVKTGEALAVSLKLLAPR
jgi:Carboxypeptidase regulatory-like domain